MKVQREFAVVSAKIQDAQVFVSPKNSREPSRIPLLIGYYRYNIYIYIYIIYIYIYDIITGDLGGCTAS